MRRPFAVFVTLVLIALAGFAGWRAWRPTALAIAHPTRGPAVEAVYATGLVEPTLEIRISPRAPGRITELRVDEGAVVKKGDTLARLEDADLQASVSELLARANYAKSQLDRSVKLKGAGLIAQDAVDQARTEYAAAQAALQRAREQLGFMRLIAPSDGRITRRDGEIGEYIPANQVIFYMAGPAPLRITADVDEEDVPRVKPGMRVLLRADAYPDRAFEGRVSEVTPRGDSVQRSYRVRIGLVGDPPLQIGMTMETNIIVAERDAALLVPTTAVADNKVWIVENERSKLRPVQLGVIGPDKTEVRGGLGEQDRIIVQPPDGLTEGRRVRPQS